jgi:hypothetical protein
VKQPNPLRYVVKKRGQFVWRPKGGTDRMRALGFRQVALGPQLTPAAIAKAAEINGEWDRLRRGFPRPAQFEPQPQKSGYAPGTLGYAFEKAMELRAALRAKDGKSWDKDQQKRDDWPRAFNRFKAAGLDQVEPAAFPTSLFLSIRNGKAVGFFPDLEREVSVSERHRVIKTWRSLWKLMASNLDILGTGRLLSAPDPTIKLPNTPPARRSVFWLHAEVVRMVDHAWATERKGLATLMAVAWDTMMSPIDTRTLTRAKMRHDPVYGTYFTVERTKTGRPGAGTLTDWSAALLREYLETLNVEPLDDMPLFYTPGAAPGPQGGRRYLPQPYSKKLVEEHFRGVRIEVFGQDETRTLADFRRSGAVEGDAGGASVEDQSNKMANRIDVNAELRQRYNPRNLPSTKRFDASREIGRKALAAGNENQEQNAAIRTKAERSANEKVSPCRSAKGVPVNVGAPKSLK